MEDDELKKLKTQLTFALKKHYQGDIEKVKEFGRKLRVLGFDLSNVETMRMIMGRGEALITLLAIDSFGVLPKVIDSIEYLRGDISRDKYPQYFEAENFLPVMTDNIV